MPIPPDHAEKVAVYLADKLPRCLFCGARDWRFDSVVVSPIVNNPSADRGVALNVGPSGLTHLPLACAECGHTEFFNWLVLAKKAGVEP
jgi:hypothetical protein